MSVSCGFYHFKRKKRIIGDKQKDREHKPLKLFFFEGESFSPHLNVARTRLSFRDACRTDGIVMRCVTSHRRHCRKNTRVRTERSRLWGRKWEQEEKKPNNKCTKSDGESCRWDSVGGGDYAWVPLLSHSRWWLLFTPDSISKNAPLWNGLL